MSIDFLIMGTWASLHFASRWFLMCINAILPWDFIQTHKVPVNANLNADRYYRFPLNNFNLPSDATKV